MTAAPLKVLDLFSGIGGFSLGLERTGGFETVAFCEIEEFPRKVLAKHWPGIPIFEDVRELRGEDVGPVDVICGGFPCQDISCAGKRAGIDGERSGLWQEFARLVGDLRPRYVIVENGADLIVRGLQRVVGDLASLGYDTEWSIVSACALGAPHPRERLFVVAYPESERGEQCGRLQFDKISETARDLRERFGQSEPIRVAHDVPNRVDRNSSLGAAVIPEIVTLIGNAILAAEHAEPSAHEAKATLPGPRQAGSCSLHN